MIELYGQIKPQRLRGHLNVVPSEGGAGGPLQAKTAYPSHSEQIIAPDEDYYGLVSVTVKPVPKLPACVVSVAEERAKIVENVVNVAAVVSVTAEHYEQPKTHALYNGVRLPKIPEDVLAQYPYAWIRKNNSTGNYDLILSKTVNWYRIDDSAIRGDYDVLETSPKWYTTPISNPTSWGEIAHNSGGFGIDTARTVLWSNHDIPNGSATATDIYFHGSEPVPTD